MKGACRCLPQMKRCTFCYVMCGENGKRERAWERERTRSLLPFQLIGQLTLHCPTQHLNTARPLRLPFPFPNSKRISFRAQVWPHCTVHVAFLSFTESLASIVFELKNWSPYSEHRLSSTSKVCFDVCRSTGGLGVMCNLIGNSLPFFSRAVVLLCRSFCFLTMSLWIAFPGSLRSLVFVGCFVYFLHSLFLGVISRDVSHWDLGVLDDNFGFWF